VNSEYKPPVWPEEPEAQQQMAHIDVAVNDLEKAVQYAIHCGATIADEQFTNNWRVMLDPADPIWDVIFYGSNYLLG
jgi:hypothetical protein